MGNRQAVLLNPPLPIRPVESVKLSANKKRSGDRREGRGVRNTHRDNTQLLDGRFNTVMVQYTVKSGSILSTEGTVLSCREGAQSC